MVSLLLSIAGQVEAQKVHSHNFDRNLFFAKPNRGDSRHLNNELSNVGLNCGSRHLSSRLPAAGADEPAETKKFQLF